MLQDTAAKHQVTPEQAAAAARGEAARLQLGTKLRELYDLGWEEDGKTKKEEAVRVSGWLDARSGWTAGKLHGARVPCVQALSARELVAVECASNPC